MSVPPELMEMMSGGGAPPPGDVGAEPGAGGAPSGGPMTTPQPKEGLQQAAMVNISMVFQLLEQALGVFGSQTEQGKAILSSLKTLTGVFGENRQKADSLIPAELMQLMQTMPGAGGGNPAQQAMGGMAPTQPAIPQGAPA